ncbi:MAG: hypothetical protein AB1298_06330 [Bacteroidota bacterium]
MKKNFCMMYFFILSFSTMFAHGEGVHQYMVREAYKLLKYYIGLDIREMKDHVGYNEEGNGQFYPGGLIVIGAYQEDHSDATNEGFGINGWLVTNTHFWDPDRGDGSHFKLLGIVYSNAYQKALKYIYGGYELRVPYPANEIIEAYNAPPNLFQFYKDGKIYYKGYYEIPTGRFIQLQHLNGEFGGPPNKTIRWLSGTSDHAFVYGIRTIAGLLYWFTKEADLFPKPLTNVSLIGTFTLYAGGIGNWYVTLQNGIEPFTYNWEIMYLDATGYLQTYESVKNEKEKKDKEKKKDGDIIFEAAPSGSWFSVGTNSPYFYKPHNPYDLRDFKLRCSVTDGSGTTKTSNEWLVDVVSTPLPQGNISADNKNNGVNSLTKYSEEKTVSVDYVLEQNYPNPFSA